MIEGEGTSESAWQASALLESMPWVDLATLVGHAQRVVVVAPHPDDEVLGCGGLIADCAQRGIEVGVVAITDGEHCYPGEPFWTPVQLQRQRRRELVAATSQLGLDPGALVHLGVSDGAVADCIDRVARQLGQMLRATDLVLCTWQLDGHPDHEAAAEAVARAAQGAGARVLQYPVWAWHWMGAGGTPGTALDAVRLAIGPATQAAKRRALDCFTTQTGHCDPPLRGTEPILPPHVLARFDRGFEVFFQ